MTESEWTMKRLYGLMTPIRLEQLRAMSNKDDKQLGHRSPLSECIAHIDALEGRLSSGWMTLTRLEQMREIARGNEQRRCPNSIMHECLCHIDILQQKRDTE